MAKTDSKRLNVRLKTQARFGLETLSERWQCSATAVLERLIAGAVSGGIELKAPSERLPKVELIPTVPVSAPGSTFDNNCSHCGNVFTLPIGRDPQTCCSPCYRQGHRNSGKCQPCEKAAFYAEKASKDSISDNSNIDYEAFND